MHALLLCKPCKACFRVCDGFYGRGGKAARLSSVCAKQLQYGVAVNERLSASKREETAAANDGGTPLLDLVRTSDEQQRIVDAIFRSDVIRGLSPHATIHFFATGRPLLGDDFTKMLGRVWTEALQSFYIDTTVLCQLVSLNDVACITLNVLKTFSRSSCSRREPD